MALYQRSPQQLWPQNHTSGRQHIEYQCKPGSRIHIFGQPGQFLILRVLPVNECRNRRVEPFCHQHPYQAANQSRTFESTPT